MPSFSFTKPSKKSNNSKTFRPKSKAEIVLKNIKGYIKLDNNINYYVITETNIRINIHPNSYKCKNHPVIYSQLLVGPYKQRLIIHRIQYYYIEHRPYLPFSVGCVVIGDIIYNNIDDNEYFMIKKCYIDNEDDVALKITKDFRDAYTDALEQRIINKYSNI